jgi:hypothetical protein
MYNNYVVDPSFCIYNLKQMYESNNNILNSIVSNYNYNYNSNSNHNLNRIIDNLITANNEIMRNILNLSNTNTNTNTNTILNNNRHQNSNRQQNNRHQNSNRQQGLRNNNLSNSTSAQNSDSLINNIIYSFLEPIVIYPTQAQIELATRVVRFGDIIRPLNTACPITLENFNENDQVLVIRHCSHIFSNTGLTSWFRSNCRCPVCRYDIRNQVTNNITDLSSNLDLSSNILPSSTNSLERRVQNNPSSILVDLIFSNLLNTHNVTDISSNNVSTNNESNTNNLPAPSSFSVSDNSITTTYDISDVSDLSGNLLHYFFTPHNSRNSHNSHK